MQTIIDYLTLKGCPFFVQGHKVLIRLNEQTYIAETLEQVKEILDNQKKD